MRPLLDLLSERLRSACSLRAASLTLVAAVVSVLVVGDGGLVEAQEYSAYSDPGKTALSFVLSREENVQSLREEFDLGDDEVEKILAAVREENEKLANEQAESDKIISANKSLSKEKVARKITDSDYDETVEDAIAGTKETVTGLLPDGGEPELESWVNERWRQEVQAISKEDSARVVETKGGKRALRCKVFATQYRGYTRYEAALPHRKLKFGSQPGVPIYRLNGKGRTVKPRIKEVGPWNTRDNYWQTGKARSMWRGLSRCVPQAKAAYYQNHNRGRDEFGRKVLNPAGADLTPAVARKMGLQKYQNAWVYVRFPWIRR